MSNHLKLLKDHILFKHISKEDILTIYESSDVVELKDVTTLLHEDDKNNFGTIFFILKGSVVLKRWDSQKDREYTFSTLEAGEAFGEVSFLDATQNAYSAQNLANTTILKLNKTKLFDDSILPLSLQNQLKDNLILLESYKLKKSYADYVDKTHHDAVEEKRYQEYLWLFSAVVIIFGLGLTIDRLVSIRYLEIGSFWYKWSYLISVIVPLLLFLKIVNYPFNSFQANKKTWKKTAKESAIIGLIIVIFGSCAFYFQIRELKVPFVEHFFLSIAGGGTLYFLIEYFFHSFFQELITRSVFQASIKKLLRDKNGFKAVFSTAALCGAIQINKGFLVVLISVTTSVIFGYIYNKNKSVLSTAGLHWVTGIFTRLFIK